MTAADEVKATTPQGMSWAAIEVAEAIMGIRDLAPSHVRAMATHYFDDTTLTGRLFGGPDGRAWARSVIVEDQREQIAALVAAAVADGVAAAPRSPLRTMSERLARVDQRFRTRVEAILSQSMRRAERHARTKALVRSGRLTKTKRAAVEADLSAGRLNQSVRAALEVSDRELLAQAFDDAADQVGAAFAERQRARRRVLAQAFDDVDADDLADRWGPVEDERSKALAAFVAIAMFNEARSRLDSGLAGVDLWDQRGEIPHDLSVPAQVVQSVVKIADGATVSANGTVDRTLALAPGIGPHPLSDRTDSLVVDVIDAATTPAPAPAPTLADIIDEQQATLAGDVDGTPPEQVALGEGWPPGVRVTYTWQVGDPARPFDPHQALGGLSFGPDEYWTVLAKDPDEWPYGTVAWQPGDHAGCQCWLDITYD